MGGTNVPKGAARREHILRATLELIGEHGSDAVTHRAVAERAGLPLSATTYWFESKEELLQETLLLVVREEVERLERLVLDLAPRELDVTEWARAVSAVLAADLEADPIRHVAFTELVLEGTRRPWLREEVARWHAAQLRLAELGLRATGAPDPAPTRRCWWPPSPASCSASSSTPGRTSRSASSGRRSSGCSPSLIEPVAGGAALAYREAGPADGPVALLVHGFPESSYMWRESCGARRRRLARARAGPGRLRRLQPDPPGTWERQVESLERFRASWASSAACP